MDIPQQTLMFVLNIMVLIGSGVIGLLVAILRESIKTLRKQIQELDKEVQIHKVHVARNYVQRPDMDNLAAGIFERLDRMHSEQREDMRELLSKIDGKVDK